jgi:hypothetical protein
MEYQGQQQHGQATNRVDEYGNPIAGAGHGGLTGGMGGHGGVGTGAAAGGHFQPMREEHKAGGILHRSGSSSSSSVRIYILLAVISFVHTQYLCRK